MTQLRLVLLAALLLIDFPAATATSPQPSTTASTFIVESPLPVTPAQDTNVLAWLMVTLGGALALWGLWLVGRKSCDELLGLWQGAKSRYETCSEELQKAQRWLNEKRAERSRYEQELAKLEGSEIVAAIIESLRAEIESAQQAEKMGEEMVHNWRVKMEQESVGAQWARRAYEDCAGTEVPDEANAQHQMGHSS